MLFLLSSDYIFGNYFMIFFRSTSVAGRHTGGIFAILVGPSGNGIAVIGFMLRHLHQVKLVEHVLA
jgi:hypothetical protein